MSFDLNTGFCDYKFGFAYYTVGSLRNGSNSTVNESIDNNILG